MTYSLQQATPVLHIGTCTRSLLTARFHILYAVGSALDTIGAGDWYAGDAGNAGDASFAGFL